VVSTVVPLVVLLLGIRAVGASTAAILSCFEPAVVVAVAAVLYGERLSQVQLVGGAAVIASVLILQAKRRRPAAHRDPGLPDPPWRVTESKIGAPTP
jgi:drug/metabolite transporter (DMT)-like permease